MLTSASTTSLSYTDITAIIICDIRKLEPAPEDYMKIPLFTAPEYSYTVGSPALIIRFQEFITDIDCNSEFIYSYQLDNSDPLPPSVTVLTTSTITGGGSLKVYVKSRTEIKFQQITVKITPQIKGMSVNDN
jgi:hypothetical protein